MDSTSNNQHHSTRPEPTKPRSGAAVWFLSLPVTFVLYVLSIGPAYRFMPGPGLPVVYRPLIQLENHCKPLDRFMTWYMEKVWGCGMW